MRRVRLNDISMAMLAAICFGSVAFAEDAGKPDTNCLLSGDGKKVDAGGEQCLSNSDLLGNLDLANPENSLFSLMGASPEALIKPKAGDSFMLSVLPTVADAFNNEQYSIGIEINPGLLMMPDEYTTSDLLGEPSLWKDTTGRRANLKNALWLSQFTASLAASKSTDGQKITRLGAGLNYNYDSGSPYFSKTKYADCMKENVQEISKELRERILNLIPTMPNPATAGEDAGKQVRKSEWFKQTYQKVIENNVKRCLQKTNPWNREVHGAGIAIYHSEFGEPDPMAISVMESKNVTGFGGWASTVGPLGDNGQYTLSVKYTDDLVRERKDGEQTTNEVVDGWRIGGRYTHHMTGDKAGGGSGKSVRGFVEAAYAEEKFGLIKDKFTQAGIGIEVQLQKNLFFQAVIGDTFGSEIDRSTYMSGQFKWAFSNAAAE